MSERSFVYELDNGMRLVYAYADSPVSHCGLLIDAGTRDEPQGKEGIAHFLEHVFFKGTGKRKAYQILNRMETVGGEINAFTTREETCIHASFMNGFFDRATELISDIVFNSTFPEKEIEKEKDVVIDEINSYLDNPMEQILDDFESQVFRGNPLGNPILGTHQTVRSFRRSDLVRFIRDNYYLDRMVFSYCGALPFEEVKKIFIKYFSEKNDRKGNNMTRLKFKSRRAEVIKLNKPSVQAHYILGGTAFSAKSNRRISMYLLNNILGGPGLNSRLNMNVREKHGYTYNIESSYTPFSDTGLFYIYLSTEPKFLSKSISLVIQELKKLRSVKISDRQVMQYQNQLIGQISIGMENKSNVMINNARSVISYNKPVHFDETVKKIKEVSSSDLLEVANRLLLEDKLGSLTFMPLEAVSYS